MDGLTIENENGIVTITGATEDIEVLLDILVAIGYEQGYEDASNEINGKN